MALPLLAGAVQEAASCESPGVRAGAEAAAGVVNGVAVSAGDGVPDPAMLIAVTRTSYAVPFVNPVMVAVVSVPVVAAVTHEPDGDTRYSKE